jgi:cytochrome P450
MSLQMRKIPRPPGPRDRAFGLRLLADMEGDYLGFWRDAQRRYGDTVYMRQGWFHHYAFMHPDQVREALVDKARSFIRYEQHIKVMGQLHGRSVIITEGETWQRQRRMLMPAFSPKRFDAYARQVTAAALDTFGGLPADGATAVDIEHTMNMLAMDIILRTMFGSRVGQDTARTEQAIRTLAAIGYAEMYLPFAIPTWAPLPRQARKRRELRLLDGLVRSHIRERRAAGANAEATANVEANASDDLLGMLLAARDDEGDGGALSDDEIRDQLMTIFLAGHETTATALAWAAWALAADPELAARAAAEADGVLGARPPTMADLSRLPLMAALVKETLRRYPPVPGVLMRRAIEDVRIGAWLVPKGSLVTLPFFVAQVDERWFPQPERFDPGRFLGEAARELPRGAWVPFGAGPRVCIGNSFATMEMTLALAMLVQRFTLRPAPGQELPRARMQVTLRPADGLRLVLQGRTPAAHTASRTPSAPASAHGCPFHA